MELLERKVDKILEDIIGASGNQLLFGLTACDSHTLKPGTFCGPNARGSVLDGHCGAWRTLNTRTGQEIDSWIGFACTNLVASNHHGEVLQEA
jgi:hypothetical protein